MCVCVSLLFKGHAFHQWDVSMNTWARVCVCVCGRELFWLVVQGVFLFRTGLCFVKCFNSHKPKASTFWFFFCWFIQIFLYSAKEMFTVKCTLPLCMSIYCLQFKLISTPSSNNYCYFITFFLYDTTGFIYLFIHIYFLHFIKK